MESETWQIFVGEKIVFNFVNIPLKNFSTGEKQTMNR